MGLTVSLGCPVVCLCGCSVCLCSWVALSRCRSGQARKLTEPSLIVTAKLNDVDARAWLADVLHRIGDHPASRLDELLPWNCRHAALKVAA